MIISPAGSTLEEFRATLTSPFFHKKVTINSYDSFNQPKPTEETFSRGDFPKIKSTHSYKLELREHNVGVLDLSKNSANIVKEMIQDGCRAMDAYNTQKAIRAYGLNAITTSGGVSTISNNAYEV